MRRQLTFGNKKDKLSKIKKTNFQIYLMTCNIGL